MSFSWSQVVVLVALLAAIVLTAIFAPGLVSGVVSGVAAVVALFMRSPVSPPTPPPAEDTPRIPPVPPALHVLTLAMAVVGVALACSPAARAKAARWVGQTACVIVGDELDDAEAERICRDAVRAVTGGQDAGPDVAR